MRAWRAALAIILFLNYTYFTRVEQFFGVLALFGVASMPVCMGMSVIGGGVSGIR